MMESEDKRHFLPLCSVVDAIRILDAAQQRLPYRGDAWNIVEDAEIHLWSELGDVLCDWSIWLGIDPELTHLSKFARPL